MGFYECDRSKENHEKPRAVARVELALSVGHARACGGDFVLRWTVDMDVVARGNAVSLSGNYLMGCDSNQAPQANLRLR